MQYTGFKRKIFNHFNTALHTVVRIEIRANTPFSVLTLKLDFFNPNVVLLILLDVQTIIVFS